MAQNTETSTAIRRQLIKQLLLENGWFAAAIHQEIADYGSEHALAAHLGTDVPRIRRWAKGEWGPKGGRLLVVEKKLGWDLARGIPILQECLKSNALPDDVNWFQQTIRLYHAQCEGSIRKTAKHLSSPYFPRSRESIRKWMNGEAFPSMADLCLLERALGWDLRHGVLCLMRNMAENSGNRDHQRRDKVTGRQDGNAAWDWGRWGHDHRQRF